MILDIILQCIGIDVRVVEQGDDVWYKLWFGVIIVLEVYNVIVKFCFGKKWFDMKMFYFYILFVEVCIGVVLEVNVKVLVWGKQYENDVRILFEFIFGVNVIEFLIIYCDESMCIVCFFDGLCSDGNGFELKCLFIFWDFMKFWFGGFEVIKLVYMVQVQYSMWVM